jgi:diguanylate cyclase (GGDEF)-like protein/PAS domain S-box-containing protein
MRILDRANEAYLAIDNDGLVIAWNAAAETMFGWQRDEALGHELADLIIPPELRYAHREGLKRFHETGTGPMIGPRTETIARHRDGAEIPVELSIVAIEEQGDGHTFHGFVRDITERKLLEAQQAEMLAQAQESARIDALTATPNRRAWDEELDRELARARRSQKPLCVALLDLDHFKAFNDAHGHRAGDRLLRRAASGWQLAVRASDFLARYGGEEFAVLLPDCGLDEAMGVIERMRQVVPEEQTVSAGVAEWNRYESAEALIDRADFALYKAKRAGRNRATAAA